jgi:hypothetical protein
VVPENFPCDVFVFVSDLKLNKKKLSEAKHVLQTTCFSDFIQEQKEAVGDKVDIDEDRANPAYIPRKGMFYEHDMRMGDDEDENHKDVSK